MIYQTWEELEEGIKECQQCKLHSTRKNIVFGCGNRKARLMLIGEGPGADEDTQGEPFVGKAGQLMNKAFIRAWHSKRRGIYCKYCEMQTTTK